jgi:hypothetical protein
MTQTIIDLLNKAIKANHNDKFRQGNLINLPAEGSLIATGDIHGHRRNFQRIVAFADLQNHPKRHLLLQEIIHGGPQDTNGGCLSYKLLFEAIDLKIKFPNRVHLIMGNHDTAFITGSKIMKNGKEMNRAIYLALENEFKQKSTDIISAMKDFLFSQPLAIRCENRILLSHSLPSDRFVKKFNQQVLHQQLKTSDIKKPGSVYLLTWGRKQSQQLLDDMATLFDVDIFILGHQPQQQGWSKAGNNSIILASDHNHGCLLPIDLTKSHRIDGLIDLIVPLTSIA